MGTQKQEYESELEYLAFEAYREQVLIEKYLSKEIVHE